MATAKLTLYKKCKITRQRNACVDSIDDYLTSIQVAADTNIDIQYQQIALNKRLKLDLPQRQVGEDMYNYLKIVQDGKKYYYFIDKANWKSTSTVEFDISLDTLNTFKSDFLFTKKTHITRQHKKRMKNVLSWVQLPDGIPYSYLDDVQYVIRPIQQSEGYADMEITWPLPGGDEQQGLVAKLSESGQSLFLRYVTSVFYGSYNEGNDYGLVITYYNYNLLTHSFEGPYTEEVTAEDMLNQYNANIYWTVAFTAGNLEYADFTNYNNMLFCANRGYTTVRIIDQKEEGINPPHFKDAYERTIDDNNTYTDWYLVYKANSTDADSGVQCQLWPKQETKIHVKATLDKHPSDFVSNVYYYFMPADASHANIMHKSRKFANGNNNVGEYMYIINNTDDSIVGHIRNEPGDYHNDKGSWFCIAYRDGSDLKIEEYECKDDFWGNITTKLKNTYTVGSAQTIIFTNYSGTTVNYYTASSKVTNLTTIYNNCNDGTFNAGSFSTTTTDKTLKSFDTLDRTDSKLVKIIAVPYVPCFQWGYITDSWLYDNDGFLYLNNPNIKLWNVIEHEYNPLRELEVWPTTFGEVVNRNDTYESKLYNSEFYIPKFVYDSFNYQYILENVDAENYDFTKNNQITYTCSSLINSRFLFQFDVPLKRSTSDYDNICIVNRNNELPIYSNKYIEYLKTGYNYDVKNKEANLQKGITTTALTTVGAGIGAALAVGAASGSAAGPVGTAVGAVVGAGIGLATSLVNLANSQAQADRNIQQKLDEANRQATSVNGGDDIDLLEMYTNGNKAKYVIYQCSEKVRQAMADLFYYCGYADDVQETPSTHTRKWFNFIQCDPVFDNTSSTYQVYKDYLDDISQKFKEGVTYYHVVTIDGTKTWDWSQHYENWELSLNY